MDKKMIPESRFIQLPIHGRPICLLITSTITDWIARHKVLLLVNHNYNKIRERNPDKERPQLKQEVTQMQLTHCSVCTYRPTILRHDTYTVQLHRPIKGDTQSGSRVLF